MSGPDAVLSCPKCNVKYNALMTSACRMPLILPCRHSICHMCVRSCTGRYARPVTCPECGQRFPIENPDRYWTQFPINFYVCTILMQDKFNKFAASRFKTSKKPEILCNKCNSIEASVHCEHCEGMFCSSCDVNLHNLTTGLCKHARKRLNNIPISIANLDNSDELKNCSLHNISTIAYKCDTCDQFLCKLCIEKDPHENHKLHNLRDKYQSSIDETLSLISQAVEFVPKIEYSELKIKEVCELLVDKLQRDLEVSVIFQNLFISLQLNEFENRTKIKEFVSNKLKEFREVIGDMEALLNDIEVFNKYKTMITATSIAMKKIDLNEVNDCLNTMLNADWFLDTELMEAFVNFNFDDFNVENGEIPKEIVSVNLDNFPKLELLESSEAPASLSSA